MALPHPSLRSMALRTLGTATVAGLALSACGSSTPSKQSYAAKAGAICTSANDQASKVAGLNSTDPTTVVNALDMELSILEKAQSQLDALKKPSGDNTSLNQALNDINKAVSDLKTVQGDVRAENKQSLQNDLATYANDQTAINSAFNAAGVPKCGQGGSGGTSGSGG